MRIKDVEFIQSLDDILEELRVQIHINKIDLLEMSPRPSGNSLQIQ